MSKWLEKIPSLFLTQANRGFASFDVVRKQPPNTIQTTHIRPLRGFRSVDLGELWRYRDLLYFLIWRDIKTHYAQTVLGIGWAVIQPAAYMVVFTIL